MIVAIKTFGCRLNQAESQTLITKLTALGHTVVSIPKENNLKIDLIVVRACSITAQAQHECEKYLTNLQLRFPNTKIVPIGCLPTANRDFEKTINELADKINNVPQKLGEDKALSRYYLKIQDGCNGHCAFCIVPSFRGKPQSVPFQNVISEAQTALEQGYHEIVITGCNLALYRSGEYTLPKLLSALATLPNPSAFRLRLGSFEPGICDDALIECFKQHPNICRFLHISLQSGSDAVLKLMRRPYSAETLTKLLANIRNAFGNNFTIGADIITGFPGETETDHSITKEIVKRYQITNLHVFPYSERPNTAAINFPNVVPIAIRHHRAEDLKQLGNTLQKEYAQSFLNKTVEVCVEKGGNHGWTSEYLACKLDTQYPRGNLVKVQIKGIESPKTLIG